MGLVAGAARRRGGLLSAVLLLACAGRVVRAQFDGTYSKGATVTVSSNPSGPTANVIDQNDQTQWQSGACFPTDFVGRPDMNPILKACSAPGACTASTGATNLSTVTDNDVYTGAGVPLPKAGGPAFVRVALPAAATVLRASVKGFGSAPIDVMLLQADGTAVKAASLDPATQNYAWVHADGSWPGTVAVMATSEAGFTLTELAVQTGPCLEWAAVDMGSPKDVGEVRTRVWSPDSATVVLQGSVDGRTWIDLKPLDPKPLAATVVDLPFYYTLRYLRVQHEITDKSGWKKAYVWGIDGFRGTAKEAAAVKAPEVAPAPEVVAPAPEVVAPAPEVVAPAPETAPKVPEKMGTWIPVYTYPSPVFDDLINSVEDNTCIKGSFKAAVLIGPNNGPPLPSDDDAPAFRAHYEKFAKASEWTTFGYVHCGYGQRPLDEVLKQIDVWLTPGADGFGDLIQGIWLNQVQSAFKTDADLSYISAIIERIRSFGKLVALNPGRSMDCKVAAKADFVNFFEADFGTWQKLNPVCTCSDVTRCIASIHGYTGLGGASDLGGVMSKARANGFEAVFITDRTMPKHYDGLPKFWKQELDGLCATAINT